MTIPQPDKLPEWASVPQNDPNKPVPNIVEPPASKKQLGWIFEEFPPSNWFNWILTKSYEWLKYFKDQRVNVAPIFGIDTSVTPNEVDVTLVPAIDNYVEGRLFLIKIANTNTGASTLNINSKGAKPILDLDATPLVGGELIAGIIYMFIYSEGAAPGQEHFILQSKPDVYSGVTGDIKFTEKSPQAGWLLHEDTQSIGNTASTATYKGDIYHDLFILWYNIHDDTVCPVSGGRGVSAEADWLADKNILMPIMSGRVPGIYGTSRNLPTPRPFGTLVGEESHTLSVEEMPMHHHVYSYPYSASRYAGGNEVAYAGPSDYDTSQAGGSQPHSNIQPTVFIYCLHKI